MSSLSELRDHCAKMAAAEHKPDCPSLGPPSRPVWEAIYDEAIYGNDGIPSGLALRGFTEPPPTCDGCNTAADRALFAQMAGEVDDYLAPQVDLLGDETVETMSDGSAG